MASPRRLPALLLLLATAALASPIALAEALDVHVGTDEGERACEGDRTSYDGSWEGGGSSGTYEYGWWREECTIHQDDVLVRVAIDGTTLAQVRAGERFEGGSEGYHSSSTGEDANGTTTSSYHTEMQQGNTSRGVGVEAGESALRADTARCEGTTWGYDDRMDSPNSSYSRTGESRDRRCDNGLFVDAGEASAAAPVFRCASWGHESEHIENDPAHNTNGTYDWRNCEAGQGVWVSDGIGAGVTVWSSHVRECWGAWNGTAHDTHCVWYGGEWTIVRVQGGGGLVWVDRTEGVPYEPLGPLLV